jgi:alkylation response protein AidB-like acyl-CoA dehydrogenase
MGNYCKIIHKIKIKALRLSRVCFEEAYNYAHKRKTFGKRLIDNQIIRAKLGIYILMNL